MAKWLCSKCGYVYTEENGDIERNIPENTPFGKVPATWVCPRCKAEKDFFKQV